MKTLRYIFAVPLGFIISAIAWFVLDLFSKLLLIPTIRPFLGENISTFFYTHFVMLLSGYASILATNEIAPSKKNIFIIISLVLSLLAVVYNYIKFGNLHISYMIGVIISFVYTLIKNKEEERLS